jgi:3-hydroxybutyryl-CoA dehydrogenase
LSIEPLNEKIVIVGSGLMGGGIGLAFASCGFDVTLVDLNRDLLERSLQGIRKSLDVLATSSLLDDSPESVFGRIRTETDLVKASRDATFVEEAIFENADVKKETFKILDSSTSKDCILASNTSSIPISKIASLCENPDRIVGAHFWNPPYLMEAVEVVRGEKSSDLAIQRTVSILRRAGKKPAIVQKDVPGQIGIRILYAMIREATSLVQNGVATPEDVDTIVREALGTRLEVLGPLELADLSGVDLVYKIAAGGLYKSLDKSEVPQKIIEDMVANKETGIKTGKGFYDWTKRSAEATIELRDQHLIKILNERREKAS